MLASASQPRAAVRPLEQSVLWSPALPPPWLRASTPGLSAGPGPGGFQRVRFQGRMKTEVPVRQGARTRETPLSGLGETGDQLRDPHRSGRPLPRGMLVGVGAGASRMRRPQEPS